MIVVSAEISGAGGAKKSGNGKKTKWSTMDSPHVNTYSNRIYDT